MHEASLAVAVWLQGSLNEGKCGVRWGVRGGGLVKRMQEALSVRKRSKASGGIRRIRIRIRFLLFIFSLSLSRSGSATCLLPMPLLALPFASSVRALALFLTLSLSFFLSFPACPSLCSSRFSLHKLYVKSKIKELLRCSCCGVWGFMAAIENGVHDQDGVSVCVCVFLSACVCVRVCVNVA